jgi:hypothetical protein
MSFIVKNRGEEDWFAIILYLVYLCLDDTGQEHLKQVCVAVAMAIYLWTLKQPPRHAASSAPSASKMGFHLNFYQQRTSIKNRMRSWCPS